MGKKKHGKGQPIEPCSDANQHAMKRIAEKERVRRALIKRQEKLREEYEAEMKRRQEALANIGVSAVTPAPEAPKVETPKKAVKKNVSEIKAVNALNPTEEE